MLINSYKFFIFLIAVVALFYALPHRYRWFFLLASSYFYYMFWDPRYAILIITTTIVVYGTARAMQGRSPRAKKICVAVSAVVNLGILFLFKYYNFFSGSMKVLFGYLGLSYNMPTLSLLMPVGISFYTFQALSYTVDVYRGTREPERNFGIFALYVSFFPVLLSGPIERSTTLLPQFYREQRFDYQGFTDGMKLMAWGFFQKVVIADRLFIYTNQVFSNPQAHTGLPLLLATYLFALYVYCDFSGYSDIAIGTARIMGFQLIPNFRRPFFAQSLAEMWRRWHMSLISWFRDYLYIPLGGNRVPRWHSYINMLIVFTLSGLWHGAQWTFVIWGSLNGVILILSRITQRMRDAIREPIFGAIARVPAWPAFAGAALLAGYAAFGGAAGLSRGASGRIAAGVAGSLLLAFGAMKAGGLITDRLIGSVKKLMMILITFQLFALGAAFFASRSVADAWYVITNCAGTNYRDILLGLHPFQFAMTILVVIVLLSLHYVQETRGSIRDLIRTKPAWFRWSLYFLLSGGILLLGYRGSQQFLYFRF